ncbi:bifunctional tetrahydrofolate synthase/dihydrofolate synthase [Salinispirillum sp. LH 10-3-1]|uniref:Dihydrofolate synthase/folylpolyglutamate synthase n=1 Tax=Salinispirillum sp. LH 10-3-1 TaxID=2952525 RepID=A0AB38YC46_9GAMM
MPSPHSSLAEWLSWLESLHPSEIDLGLDRQMAVQQRMALDFGACKIITVAGTNGKGSTATLTASLLQAHGYRVGLYTSPHFLHFTERVAVQGTPVTEEAMVQALAAVEKARGDTSLTYFEFTTLAAFRLFADAALDYMVLEVGLGGRLDAVNALDTDCAIVTSIGLDHVDWLGDDIAGIAREKAGIARPGKPLLVGRTDCPEAFVQVALINGCQLTFVDTQLPREPGAWRFVGSHQQLDDLPWPLLPYPSALLALRALELLGIALQREKVTAVLQNTSMPGRLQRLAWHGNEIWLDVAHNPHAADYVVRQLQHVSAQWTIILGMLKDKDASGVVQSLARLEPDWHLVTLTGSRGQQAKELAERTGLMDVVCHHSVAAALDALEPNRQQPVLVCGSFHTVADALNHMPNNQHG